MDNKIIFWVILCICCMSVIVLADGGLPFGGSGGQLNNSNITITSGDDPIITTLLSNMTLNITCKSINEERIFYYYEENGCNGKFIAVRFMDIEKCRTNNTIDGCIKKLVIEPLNNLVIIKEKLVINNTIIKEFDNVTGYLVNRTLNNTKTNITIIVDG